MKRKKVIPLILILIVVECISVFMTYKTFNNQKLEISSIKLKNDKFNDAISIYVKEEGESEYKKYTKSTKWLDSNDYSLNSMMTKCYNEEGEDVTESYFKYTIGANPSATVTTNSNIYCHLYFDKNALDMVPVIIKFDPITENTITYVDTKTEATDDKGIVQYCYSYKKSSATSYGAEDCITIEDPGLVDHTDGGNKVFANTYRFKNLTANTEYDFKVVVYDEKGQSDSKEIKKYKTAIRKCIDPQSLRLNFVGGMYRYQGTDNVNNYICFGSTTECKTNPDKYLYRIIGITETGEMKLIKVSALKYDYTVSQPGGNVSRSTKTFLWGNSDSNRHSWENSYMIHLLNGDSYGYNYDGGSIQRIFINNPSYEYVAGDTKWSRVITLHDYKYGVYSSSYSSSQNQYVDILNGFNADNMYAKENAFTNSVKKKIGLMYLHDYLYAYPGGNAGSSTDLKKSWIYFQKDSGYNDDVSAEWTMTINANQSGHYLAWTINTTGSPIALAPNVVDMPAGAVDSQYYAVRPVFYLDSAVNDAGCSGTGTSYDPFIINIDDVK